MLFREDSSARSYITGPFKLGQNFGKSNPTKEGPNLVENAGQHWKKWPLKLNLGIGQVALKFPFSLVMPFFKNAKLWG